MQSFLSLLERCELCPRRCRVNRLAGETGWCGAGRDVLVSHFGPHHGEEPPVSGSAGAGNIFFSPCNMRCLFCQNHQISHTARGQRMSVEELADLLLLVQGMGVHNINFVSPTPYAPQAAAAVVGARARGLRIPVVYNTNAYENEETIEALQGIVDIYLPDLKYWQGAAAAKLSAAPGYPEAARQAILRMKAQTGDLDLRDGIARRGLLVRHLVLPARLAGTRAVLAWIARRLGTGTFVSLMSQYYPLYRAGEVAMLARKVRREEYELLVEYAGRQGLTNVFVQELESADLFVPDFNRTEPFEGDGFDSIARR